MRPTIRLRVTVTAAVGAALSVFSFATAAPAYADVEARGVIASVRPGHDTIEVDFRAVNVPAGTRLESKSIRVFLDGDEARSTAWLKSRRGSSLGDRRVALVIDTSGSMAGGPLAAARTAALAYIETVPPDVQVGLVSFSRVPRVVVEPSTDRRDVEAAMQRLKAGGGTSVYDAVMTARAALGATGERRVLLLTDGNDSASVASIEEATIAIRDSGITLDAVALGKPSLDVSDLAQLTAAGKGRVLRAGGAGEAAAAFVEAARAFSTNVKLTVTVPSELAGSSADLDVQVTTSAGDVLHAETPVILPARVSESGGWLASKAALAVGLLSVFLGLATCLVVGVRSGDSVAAGRRRTQQILSSYTVGAERTSKQAPESSRIGKGAVARGALALSARLLRGRQIERRLATRLDAAAVRFTPREWLVVHATISLVVLTSLYLVANLFVAFLGAFLAALCVGFWLSTKGSRRAAAFDAQMPDALQLVAAGLATGYSLPQALDSIVREGQAPISEEIGRALAEVRLGIPLEDALESVAERMSSNDFEWVVIAIRVQREAGGNLSEVLTNVCQTMRERAALRRHVKALSAEGRLGAVILVLLPVVISIYLSLINPDFFRPMLETTLGLLLLGGSAVSLLLGALWMKKLVKVEM